MPAYISFCTVCMNRLHQLKRTLLQNIRDNEDYPDLEFILLDYNSQDGMAEWVYENCQEYLATGKLVYYRTYSPAVFNHSHSKNVAFTLATGDIVCSINADHYTGRNYAHYVHDAFEKGNNIVLTPIDFFKTKGNHRPPGDVMGKVCVKKSDFLSVNGFDESMGNYGFEDYDFINRLEMSGVRRVLIEDPSFLEFIAHSDEERYSTGKLTGHLDSVYIHYCSPAITKIIFLYKDSRFEEGTIIDNYSIDADNPIFAYTPRNSRFEFSLKEQHWNTGRWNWNGSQDKMLFYPDTGTRFSFESYFPVSDPGIVQDAVRFRHLLASRSIMEQNLETKKIMVNPLGFGRDIIFKNFNHARKDRLAGDFFILP
ncbi:glycosyltransferase family 2 protein [Dinghuibacter silviterrae]|uniref:Glycosyl transferase family 2 n=1 Tax=Dinghuibacter silviterrae TaxID=1539049 RepID=A0A4R8DSF3_9BACT|nr:glycosyltransferase family A protein [Dinghuibacter silviterrae]TDX00979.1 glycosyl transferase family 2 [Dinghuibacter silviterrae]